jgi:hypothetical protein
MCFKTKEGSGVLRTMNDKGALPHLFQYMSLPLITNTNAENSDHGWGQDSLEFLFLMTLPDPG